MKSEDTRNLILAIVLSAIVLIGWSYLFPQKTRPTPPIAPVATGTRAREPLGGTTAPPRAAPRRGRSPPCPRRTRSPPARA